MSPTLIPATLPKHRLLIAFLAAAAVAVLASTTLTNSASAHGSVIDPASRNYGCWLRWGSDFQNPRMATEDPMCWQAWQANPNAMWNWNGLYREGLAGNHQGRIPDGQLCSGGRAEGGRYNAMDAVGNWRSSAMSNNFRIKLFDQASHGADYIRVYVTKQGFNPLTQPLGWGNLDLVGQIGYTPASQWTQETGGVSIQVGAAAPGRTGRHIVYTIWQASHLDQSYYLCSDVTFGGTNPTGSPTPSPSVSPSPPVSPSPSPSVSPPPSPRPPGSCSATYREFGSWSGGFQGEVTVTAGSSAITTWTTHWNYQNGQTISSVWNGVLQAGGPHAMVGNMPYNGALAANASTTFGFLGSWSGTNPPPTIGCSATS
jgi:predicted carbohydrate-binding protein with CBM5 and CBM33 domain